MASVYTILKCHDPGIQEERFSYRQTIQAYPQGGGSYTVASENLGTWAGLLAAAALMEIDQPKVSALLNGRLTNFSSDRLMRLLTALGQDVDITVIPLLHQSELAM